jgi:hypothetical protein
MTGLALSDEKPYWENHAGLLNGYDVVILTNDDPMEPFLDLRGRKISWFRDYVHEYRICEKVPDSSGRHPH